MTFEEWLAGVQQVMVESTGDPNVDGPKMAAITKKYRKGTDWIGRIPSDVTEFIGSLHEWATRRFHAEHHRWSPGDPLPESMSPEIQELIREFPPDSLVRVGAQTYHVVGYSLNELVLASVDKTAPQMCASVELCRQSRITEPV